MTIKRCNFRSTNFPQLCSKKATNYGNENCDGEDNCIDYQTYINTLKDN